MRQRVIEGMIGKALKGRRNNVTGLNTAQARNALARAVFFDSTSVACYTLAD